MLKANSSYYPSNVPLHHGQQIQDNQDNKNHTTTTPNDHDKRERAVSFDQFLSALDTQPDNCDDLGFLCRRIMNGEDLIQADCFGYRQLFNKSSTKPVRTNITQYAVSKSLAMIIQKILIQSSKDGMKTTTGKAFKIFEREKKTKLHKKITTIGESLSNRFSGRHSMIAPEEITPVDIPSLDTLTQFIFDISFSTQMEYECSVVSLVYLTRFIKISSQQLQFSEYNWRSIVLSCMLIANKMWDDFHVSNDSYCIIFPGLTLERVNQLEIGFLKALDYNIWVSPSTYAENHFLIQSCIAEEEIKIMKQQQILESKKIEQRLQSPPNSKKTTSTNFSDPDSSQKSASFRHKTHSHHHEREKSQPTPTLKSMELGESISIQNFDPFVPLSTSVSTPLSTELQTHPSQSHLIQSTTNFSNSIKKDGNSTTPHPIKSETNQNNNLNKSEICQFIDRERKTIMITKTPSSPMDGLFFNTHSCCVLFFSLPFSLHKKDNI